jgi:EF-P beta-lysylation protein EpmB
MTWVDTLRSSITSASELLDALQLTGHPEIDADPRPDFAVRVPRPFVNRMQIGNAHDPLLRQVLSVSDERLHEPGYGPNPLDEQDGVIPGVLHKYASRVLLIVRGGCAVNCRYCFRRHFPYAQLTLTRAHLEAAVDYVRANEAVTEVIFSGGDPLMADDASLHELFQVFGRIPHVKRLRVHTRLPVVIPERVTDGLISAIAEAAVPVVCVLHINHAQEVDDRVCEAAHALRRVCAWILNQAVILHRVNDTADAQVALSEALFTAGILPYYLNVLDRVVGAQHFAVQASQVARIEAGLQGQLPGFLVPKIVREVAGAHHKVHWREASTP